MKQNEKGLVNRKSSIKKGIVFLLFIKVVLILIRVNQDLRAFPFRRI